VTEAVAELAPLLGGTKPACELVGRPRATHCRRLRPPVTKPPAAPRSTPPSALSPAEQNSILELLRSERFVDASPAQVWAMLLDEGTYLAGVSTMYRLLRDHGEVREAAARPPIRPGSAPSWWPGSRTASGRGTSPS